MTKRTDSTTITVWTRDPAPQRFRQRTTRFRDPAAAEPAAPSVAILDTARGAGHDETTAATPALQPEFARDDDGRWLTRLSCPPGTSFYGTGEVAGALLRTGLSVTLWNTDSFGYNIETPSLYQSHPWVLGVRADGTAFGLLIDTTFRAEIVLEGGVALVASEGIAPAVYVLEGPNPEAVLEELAALIGTTPLPPRWALGFHQCRYSYSAEHEVLGIAEEFRARWLPCDTIWMDIDYMVDSRPFTIDTHKFPDAEKMILQLRTKGFRTAWILDPGIKNDEQDATFISG
ncbi:MAG: TIM-barrel domain-containing protein, partial [Phycisphaerales bacterium]